MSLYSYRNTSCLDLGILIVEKVHKQTRSVQCICASGTSTRVFDCRKRCWSRTKTFYALLWQIWQRRNGLSLSCSMYFFIFFHCVILKVRSNYVMTIPPPQRNVTLWEEHMNLLSVVWLGNDSNCKRRNYMAKPLVPCFLLWKNHCISLNCKPDWGNERLFWSLV